MTVEEWLGKDNKLGIDIWEKKYRYNNESFDEWLDRVSGGDEKVKQLIQEKKFMFGGRTLSNRGTDKKGSMSNCYSRGFVKDNLEDLMQAASDIAITFKAQGGQGISLSKLRPKGCGINHGQFKSDGIIPFMEIYNRVTESISQGGSRKGALIMTLDAWHKEAREFITIKSEEGKIQKANLSLEIDDEFMECVKKYFETGERITKHIKREYNGNAIEYDVTPIDLYKLMMGKAWDWGEPGCIFTNRFRKYNLMEYDDEYKVESCNPCVAADTYILTDKGYYPIIDLIGKEINIWNGHKFSTVVPRLTATNQTLVKVTFSNGSILKCTPYHKFILSDGTRKECQKLCVGDKLKECEFPVINGSLVDVKHEKDFVPLNDYTINSKISWLAGIVDSDGSNNNDGSISITSINEEFIKKIFYMLQTLGVSASYNKCECGGDNEFGENMKNKTDQIKDLYRICISPNNVIKLNQLGFAPHGIHNDYIPNRSAERHIVVTNIEKVDETEDVYCFTENDNHSGIFNGVLTAQCGEQPLSPHSACNLGSINLSEFVKHPFTVNAYLDTDDFVKAVKIAVEALDDVLDENIKNHPLKQQREKAKNYRNIGLGIMGLYDMFVKLNMTYGSKESIELADSLMNLMFRAAFIKSVNLAKEKSCFPAYDSKILSAHIIRDHFTIHELESIGAYDYGLRNCSLLSIAPAGSIGSMLNISTGCEPAFALSYKRKTESLNGGTDKYYEVFTGVASEYKKKFGDVSLPDCFVTAGDLKWKDRIDMQSVLQDHVDTAISSTVNLPNQIPQSEIEQLYLYAWEKGLKGVTIYRDGCKRSGILSSTDANIIKNNEEYNKQKLPRGMIIKADNDCIGKKRTLQTGCGTLHCVALFDPVTGDLLETYLSKGSAGGCLNTLTGLSRLMSLSARGGVDVYSIVDQLKSCGTCPSYAVRRATKHDTSVGSSCPVAIGNALIDMYNEMQNDIGLDDETVETEDFLAKEEKPNQNVLVSEGSKISQAKCPECGGILVFEGGCHSCKTCGYTKCE